MKRSVNTASNMFRRSIHSLATLVPITRLPTDNKLKILLTRDLTQNSNNPTASFAQTVSKASDRDIAVTAIRGFSEIIKCPQVKIRLGGQLKLVSSSPETQIFWAFLAQENINPNDSEFKLVYFPLENLTNFPFGNKPMFYRELLIPNFASEILKQLSAVEIRNAIGQLESSPTSNPSYSLNM